MRVDCIRFLVDAAAKGNIDEVSRAIGAGVDADGISSRGSRTPLESACWEGKIEVVKLLLQHGASVVTEDHLPLSVATYRGHSEIVRLLLEHGAEIDGRNIELDDYTPLMEAASEAHLEIAGLLIAAGADIDAQNEIGDTPLSRARDYEWRYSAYNPVVDLLYEKGANNYGSYQKLEDNPPRPDKSTIGKPLDSMGEPRDLNESPVVTPTYANAYEEGMAKEGMVEQLIHVVDEGQK